jgi:hypothetical protein
MIPLKRLGVAAFAPLLILTSVPSHALTGLFQTIPFQKVYDPGQTDTAGWDRETKGVDIRSFEGIATVEGRAVETSWGSVYKTVSVDLDQHPLLEINVLSVSGSWYLILAGDQFPDGYIRLMESNETGRFSFDVPLLGEISGRQKFQVKVGVSNPGGGRLAGESVSFSKLAFQSRGASPADASPGRAARAPARPPRAEGLSLLDPAGADIDLWRESVGNAPPETRFSLKDGLGIVKGKNDKRNWGAAHRLVEVDLSAYPILEIGVLESSRQWYLILASPAISGGYVRLAEKTAPGAYNFDVPRLTGLTGIQEFDVQVGISYPEGNSIKGEWMVFDVLRFRKRGP